MKFEENEEVLNLSCFSCIKNNNKVTKPLSK